MEKIKYSFKEKIRKFFTAFSSLFIKKEKLLEAPSEQLTEELNTVNSDYEKLLNNLTFEGLKDTYEKYKIGVDSCGKLIAIEKNTGYVKEDKEFVDRVRFVSLWRKSAFGDNDIKDEEKSFAECFSDESKGIYEEIKNEIQTELRTSGNISTIEVINKMKDSEYKWGRITCRRLLRTNQYADTVNNYFRSITSNRKRQTEPMLSLSQVLYGIECYDENTNDDKKDC